MCVINKKICDYINNSAFLNAGTSIAQSTISLLMKSRRDKKKTKKANPKDLTNL